MTYADLIQLQAAHADAILMKTEDAEIRCGSAENLRELIGLGLRPAKRTARSAYYDRRDLLEYIDRAKATIWAPKDDKDETEEERKAA